MANIGTLIDFTDGNVLYAAQLDSNFADIRTAFNTYAVQTDVATTVTVTHTWSSTQTFTGGWTAGAACSISTGGLTVTGNSTITGTLGGVTTLTCTTVTATNLGGTLSTAAQANVTSVGTLTSLAVAGAVTVTTAKTTLAATAAGFASLNLPHGTAPSSPSNGDVWTTTGGLYSRINGSTVGPYLSSVSWDTANWVQASDDTTTNTAFTSGAEATFAIPAGTGNNITESGDVLTIGTAGFYLVSAVIAYVSGTEGSPSSRYVAAVNSGFTETYALDQLGSASMSGAPHAFTFVRYFAAADTLQFRLFHNGGSSVTYSIACAFLTRLRS